jgi:hypothetical protein
MCNLKTQEFLNFFPDQNIAGSTLVCKTQKEETKDPN